ncbi:MAG: hypothetical protein P9M14_06980 [Candidatus Alcyoniella australis]|nr:hypothetical protein [Candidatus Alcyoniella australis]
MEHAGAACPPHLLAGASALSPIFRRGVARWITTIVLRVFCGSSKLPRATLF